MTALSQLAYQITRWREILPPELQWSEDDSLGFPSTTAKATQTSNRGYSQSLDPNLSSQQQSESPHFTIDLNSEPIHYPYVYDIHIALLRTRYYYAKYMVYRPSVYKALHYPDQITQEDAEGVAECLRVSSHFPLTPSILNVQMLLCILLMIATIVQHHRLKLLLGPFSSIDVLDIIGSSADTKNSLVSSGQSHFPHPLVTRD